MGIVHPGEHLYQRHAAGLLFNLYMLLRVLHLPNFPATCLLHATNVHKTLL